MRIAVAVLAILASQIAGADVAERAAAGKALVYSSKEARSYYKELAPLIQAALNTCAPPGTKVVPGQSQLTVVGDVSAKGALSDVLTEPVGGVAKCVARQLQKSSLPHPPASLLGTNGFPLVVDITLSEGFKAKPPAAATPTFSQLLVFPYPDGFVTLRETSSTSHFSRESLPAGESAEGWSQKISLDASRGLASNSQASLPNLLVSYAALYQTVCPRTFALKEWGYLQVDGRDAFISLLGCGSVQKGTPHSETGVVMVIKGSADIYMVHWVESAAPMDQAPVLDQAAWKARVKQMTLIRLCTPVAGEAAPYPSCSAEPAGK